MKIAVLMKRVPDTASTFKIGADEKSVDTNGLKYVMSPYDEHAMEEAIATRDAGQAEEVIVFTMGPEGTQETIRTALAMGADRAVFVKDDGVSGYNSKGIALALAAALKTESPGLIFAGKQAVDDDASQVPERVAELLEMPHVSIVTSFALDGATATVEREIEGGSYTVEVSLPALFTTQKGINTPRYPTLPNIMKAKKKEVKEFSLGDLGLSADELASGIQVEGMSLPRQDRLNKILEGDTGERVQQLLSILREEDKDIEWVSAANYRVKPPALPVRIHQALPFQRFAFSGSKKNGHGCHGQAPQGLPVRNHETNTNSWRCCIVLTGKALSRLVRGTRSAP